MNNLSFGASEYKAATFDADIEALLGIGSQFVCYGVGETDRGRAKTKHARFADFAERLSRERRTREPLAEYLAWSKEAQGALKAEGGFWTPGIYRDGKRARDHLESLSIVALDIDNATPELLARMQSNGLPGIEHAFHSTRKHRHDAPRLRFAAPLSRPVSFDEYESLSRLIAFQIDQSMNAVDKVSFRPIQVMYWPSCSADSEFVSAYFPGAPIDPDAVFEAFRATGKDPFSFTDLPFSAAQGPDRKTAAKAENPRAKGGAVGAFCRVHGIEEAFAQFLGEFYQPGTGDRWSAIGGSTGDGVIFHEGLFATSFHGSDPLSGLTVNAWDAVRLCLFGELDGENAESLPMGQRPSFKAMAEFARGIPEVMQDMTEHEAERAEAIDRALSEMDAERSEEEREAAGPLNLPVPAGGEAGSLTASPEREAADRATFGSDTWAGARFAAAYRGRKLYDSSTARWLRWSDPRWTVCTMEDIAADAKAVTAKLLAITMRKIETEPSTENQARFKQIARLHGSAAALARMEASARSEPGMSTIGALEFDRDPWSLTVENGVVDVRTSAHRAAQPEDRNSKLAGVAFDPAAIAPMWEAFLTDVLPDPEIRAFVQRAAGYTLTGIVDEEVFFTAYGTGRNGKSVFANVLAALFGDYGAALGAALVTRGKSEGEADRMKTRLPGVRFAAVNETAVGDLWDSAKIKELASRERIPARHLYKEAFDFWPSHKLWIRTNHLPGSLDAGDGFWRRCIPISFTTQIAPERIVADLDRRIIATELPGVLNWLLAGAGAWMRDGLQVPATIRAEVSVYREETDLIGQWFEERTIRSPAGRVSVAECFQDYASFCSELNAHAGTAMSFGRAMAARGEKRDPSRAAGRRFVGFKLRRTDARFSDDQDDSDLLG